MSRHAWAALIVMAAVIVIAAILADRDPYERPLVPFSDDGGADAIYPFGPHGDHSGKEQRQTP